MSGPMLLPPAQMRRIEPFCPRSRGLRRVDHWPVASGMSGIVCVIRHGLRWQDAPAGHGPHKTLCKRLMRWSGPACSSASSRSCRPRAERLGGR